MCGIRCGYELIGHYKINMKHKFKIARGQELRECKRLANEYLQQNIERRRSKSKGWESRVYKNNIKKLKNIIAELNIYNKDSEIEKYVNDEIASHERQKSGEGNITDHPEIRVIMNRARIGSIRFNIMRHSPSYSVEHDLHWITDGTVGNQINIAIGKESIEIYSKYLKNKIALTKKEVIPFLSSKDELKSSAIMLKDVIKNLKKKYYSIANILIIIAIEGLARIICRIIYTQQNPNLTKKEIDTYIFHTFLSLESLIMQGDFRPDHEISLVDGYLLNQHVSSDELESIEKEFLVFKKKSEWLKENLQQELEQISSQIKETENDPSNEIAKDKLQKLQEYMGDGPMSINEKRKISIKPRLEFLLRSLKQDRNLIIHGKYSEFNTPGKSYLYLSALIKVNNILMEYKKYIA